MWEGHLKVACYVCASQGKLCLRDVIRQTGVVGHLKVRCYMRRVRGMRLPGDLKVPSYIESWVPSSIESRDRCRD